MAEIQIRSESSLGMNFDLFKCGLCKMPFDSGRRIPIVGLCGHTICLMCKSTLLKFCCPIRTQCVQNSFILTIPNYRLSAMMDYMGKFLRQTAVKRKGFIQQATIESKETLEKMKISLKSKSEELRSLMAKYSDVKLKENKEEKIFYCCANGLCESRMNDDEAFVCLQCSGINRNSDLIEVVPHLECCDCVYKKHLTHDPVCLLEIKKQSMINELLDDLADFCSECSISEDALKGIEKKLVKSAKKVLEEGVEDNYRQFRNRIKLTEYHFMEIIESASGRKNSSSDSSDISIIELEENGVISLEERDPYEYTHYAEVSSERPSVLRISVNEPPKEVRTRSPDVICLDSSPEIEEIKVVRPSSVSKSVLLETPRSHNSEIICLTPSRCERKDGQIASNVMRNMIEINSPDLFASRENTPSRHRFLRSLNCSAKKSSQNSIICLEDSPASDKLIIAEEEQSLAKKRPESRVPFKSIANTPKPGTSSGSLQRSRKSLVVRAEAKTFITAATATSS